MEICSEGTYGTNMREKQNRDCSLRKDFKNFLDGFMFCEDEQMSVSGNTDLSSSEMQGRLKVFMIHPWRGGKWAVVGSVLKKKRGVKNKNTEGLRSFKANK